MTENIGVCGGGVFEVTESPLIALDHDEARFKSGVAGCTCIHEPDDWRCSANNSISRQHV